MAQGLGFIEFSTGDVLSAAAANGYLASQTVMVFADSAARTTAITTPYEGMMSYLKDTNSVEYYSGSAWVAVSGGSSGGMTLLSTTTLSGSSTTIGSIDQTYKDLQIVISGVTTTANHNAIRIAPNGSTTISDYAMVRNVAGTGASTVGGTAGYIDSYSASQYNNSSNAFILIIYNYADTTYNKAFDWNGFFTNSDPVKMSFSSGGGINTTSAISSLVISPSANTFTAGQVKVYGVK